MRRPVPLAIVFALPLLAGCGDTRFFAPDPASDQADDILQLWQGTFVTAMVVGAIVYALIIFVIVRYRRRSDAVPRQGEHNTPLEVVYTVIPIAIVAVIFGFNVVTQDRVTALKTPDLEVDVTGFQWQWQFTYVDEDVTITGATDVRPELVLPVDQRVRFNLHSPDVIHSFWVPEFFEKLDVIPGVDNRLELVPDREGTYTGRCAEFCGLDHWRMSFTVSVVSQAAFDDWLAEQQDGGSA
ncbi:MAG: aa3-type cytochrome oxidase subunit II [Acidimicrobiales bacterium]